MSEKIELAMDFPVMLEERGGWQDRWLAAWEHFSASKADSKTEAPTPTETYRMPSVDEKMKIHINKRTHRYYVEKGSESEDFCDLVIEPK